MEFPNVHPDQEEFADVIRCTVRLTADVALQVTVTNSLSAARMWIRDTEYFHRRHLDNLQVGLALHGDGPHVVTLSLGRQCLIVHLGQVLGPIGGRLVSFLTDPANRFASSTPLPLVLGGGLNHLHDSCSNALTLLVPAEDDPLTFAALSQLLVGANIPLDPVVAAGDWGQYPLTNQQMILSVCAAHVSYLALLAHLDNNNNNNN